MTTADVLELLTIGALHTAEFKTLLETAAADGGRDLTMEEMAAVRKAAEDAQARAEQQLS